LSTGFVTCEEIREALKDFKRSGKFVLAYGDLYDQREYYICSVADKVLLNPQGMFNWAGLASTPVFYADALKKIGLHVEVFKVGLYKSAVEPYINTHMSEPSRGKRPNTCMGSGITLSIRWPLTGILP
jgi:protease-4